MKPEPTKLLDMSAQIERVLRHDRQAGDHAEEVEHLEVTPRPRRLEAQLRRLDRGRVRDSRAEEHPLHPRLST